jgi:hypothetical protein
VSEIVAALVAGREQHGGLTYIVEAPDGKTHSASCAVEFRALVAELRERYGDEAEFAIHTARPNA